MSVPDRVGPQITLPHKAFLNRRPAVRICPGAPTQPWARARVTHAAHGSVARAIRACATLVPGSPANKRGAERAMGGSTGGQTAGRRFVTRGSRGALDRTDRAQWFGDANSTPPRGRRADGRPGRAHPLRKASTRATRGGAGPRRVISRRPDSDRGNRRYHWPGPSRSK